MPEFILETAGGVALPDIAASQANHYWGSLDDFTQGYIESLFFTSECPGVDTPEFITADHQRDMEAGRADGVLPCDVGFSDLHPKALQSIIADCAAFQLKAETLLESAYDIDGVAYDATMAGRDFWFTRNGHGVGFWDRGLGDIGDQLSALCGWRTEFGELNPFYGNQHIEPDSCVHVE